ncbi:YktB family protein [Aquisalibacillus elongatus]|uniref:UPF0637 protein EDC24_1024 n=1 Tax=Aquisalibacillus elongatus TaxID=485577 RepID=A0A3N5CBJ1_9BACI|nr:DUF1054 domain-containing protein [Aquisalibacillus elongatus]RPF56135.1 uncharacterized protein YktB (UPF0637 family) [Aquisalibacillus elongatus]
MANFTGFTEQDFDVFKIDGLDERMEELRGRLSPKLETIAHDLEPTATSATGDEMFVHVAKHARRTKNPPNDTWAALASGKRGYKKLPHFQVGLWESHVFVWFAVIYESPIKGDFARQLKEKKEDILTHIPDHFVWSKDHTQPDTISHQDMKDGQFDQLVDRLENVKKAELLCGITFDRDDKRLKDGQAFIKLCEEAIQTLSELYNLTKNVQHN